MKFTQDQLDMMEEFDNYLANNPTVTPEQTESEVDLQVVLAEATIESLLFRLEEAQKNAQVYRKCTDGSYEACYDMHLGFMVEKELKRRGVPFTPLRG